VREELIHLSFTHFSRMALLVEENKSPNPGDVGFLGAEAVVPRSNSGTDPVEQFRLPGTRMSQPNALSRCSHEKPLTKNRKEKTSKS
jgi:hypothetical protein